MQPTDPFAIFCNGPTLSATAVFPVMQRIASISSAFAGAEIRLPIAYWLRGITFDTSLYTPNTLCGLAVVVGQDQQFVGYSQALCAPINHPAFPNGGTAVSETVYWEAPPGSKGIYIPPNRSIALYGYRSGAGENMWGAAALQLVQAEP